MSKLPETPNQTAWRTFLMDVELARNYMYVNAVYSIPRGPQPRNPILDSILPSLFYVRLGSILDDFFEGYITSSGLVMSKSDQNTFGGRIKYLTREQLLKDASKVDSLRERRNDLAHEASRSCTWDELDQAIDVVDAELQHLGLSGPRPHFDFYAVREAPTNPTDPRYLMSTRYCFGLNRDGKSVIEFGWTTHMCRT
jgi:hypothetical protein